MRDGQVGLVLGLVDHVLVEAREHGRRRGTRPDSARSVYRAIAVIAAAGAPAADVADRDRPPARRRVDVVEVAAHLATGAGGSVHGAELDARQGGQGAGSQRSAEGGRRPRLVGQRPLPPLLLGPARRHVAHHDQPSAGVPARVREVGDLRPPGSTRPSGAVEPGVPGPRPGQRDRPQRLGQLAAAPARAPAEHRQRRGVGLDRAALVVQDEHRVGHPAHDRAEGDRHEPQQAALKQGPRDHRRRDGEGDRGQVDPGQRPTPRL